MKTKVFTLLAASLALTALAHASSYNLGFDTGSLAGWNVSPGGGATVVGSTTDYPVDVWTLEPDLTKPYAVAPVSGPFMARLEAGATELADLESFLGLGAGDLSTAENNPFGLANGTAISRTLNLAAGQSFSLAWNFLAVDSYDDFAFFSVVGPFGSALTTLASVSTVGSGAGTGWQRVNYLAAADGAYTFGFGIGNYEDNTINSVLYLDVPDSGSVIALAGGAVLALAALRRRQRSVARDVVA